MATYCNQDRLINIEYEPEYSEDESLSELFVKLSGDIRSKKWLLEDFDGNSELNKKMREVIASLAEPEFLWMLQFNTNMKTSENGLTNIYYKNGKILLLEENGKEEYKGKFYENFEFVDTYIMSKFKFPQNEIEDNEFKTQDMVAISKERRHMLFNITKYSFNDGKLKGEEAVSSAIFDKNGAYVLYLDEENERFVQVNEQNFNTYNKQIFNLEVSEYETA